ncbi:MAG: tight adherence pilus pseudopilin TadF [Acinetobacter sp.]
MIQRNPQENEDGSISIEAGFYFAIYALIVSLFIDYATSFMAKSKLERVSASALSILRERTYFYNESIDVSRIDADEISATISKMLKNVPHATLVLFAKNESNGFLTKSYFIGNEDIKKKCSVIKDYRLDADIFNKLSPVFKDSSGSEKQYPLYSIVICQPGNKSLFKTMSNFIGEPNTVENIVRNIAIYR